jgi:signal transduction histidine kinase
VEVCDDAGAVKVSVSDEGPGLGSEARSRVFERYARIPGTSDKPRGAGLGLYICRCIVELHGGSIGVDSEPEQGASFWLRLERAT